jgi:hypothetical protein
MDGTLDFANYHWGRILNSNNATQTHSIFVKLLTKYLFRHAKGKSMVNFYIVNALGQNLANSESCPILRLL